MTQPELAYACFMMTTRDELKALIDQMPEDELDTVRASLDGILHPVAHFPNPMVEKMMRRAEELRELLPERLKQLQAGNPPDSIRGFCGGGSFGSGPPPVRGNGEHEYSWQEGRTHVRHRLVLHEDHEMDFVERLEIDRGRKNAGL